MTDEALATAERGALYRFLAEGFLQAPSEAWLELAAESADVSTRGENGLKAQHSWLFDLNVYPYASVYLDPSGMMNAPWTAFVSGVYRALGLEVTASSVAAPDHLGVQLEALAALLEREDGAASELDAARARHAQQALLCEHLLPWAPCFVWAVERTSGGLYARLARWTLELLAEHAEALLETVPVQAFAFPEGGEEVEGLSRLLVPARSGLFLCREDLRRLGRGLELALRFAERKRMLEQLIAAAVQAEVLHKLLAALRREGERQREGYLALQRAHPPLAPLWGAWLLKLEGTLTWLTGEAALAS
jgi:TorA maturation chaperone TorD